MNPFHDVVVGYVFTAWKDVSNLQQNGISHISKFTKLVNEPGSRAIPGAPFLEKSKAAREIMIDTSSGPREMWLYISNEGSAAEPEFGVIPQDRQR
eukprot:UN19641